MIRRPAGHDMEMRGDALYFPDGPDKPGVGVAGVWVILVNANNYPVAVVVTDAAGHFTLTDLAPGPGHRAFFVPPPGWRIPSGYASRIPVRGGTDRLRVVLEPWQQPTSPDELSR